MSEKPPPKQSPYSPFPFGSPVSKSNVEAVSNGFPSSTSTRTSPSSATFLSTLNSPFLKGRVRAKEAYGGPVMFGGNSTNRKSRLLSASPYAAAAISSRKSHQRPLFEESTSSRRGSSAANTPSPAPSPSPSSSISDNGMMSSTARLIFDTLEKMSTPVRDAQKLIPSVSLSSPPRAEKRRLIAEQLDWCHDSLKRRRRPRLGHSDRQAGSDHLNGPPLRTVFSPLPPTPKPRSTATKSARLVPSSNASSLTSVTETGQFDLYQNPQSSLEINVDKKAGGKIRTKISEKSSQKVSKAAEGVPKPAFIASHNAPLPLKSLPVISYNTEPKITAVTSSASSSNSFLKGFTNSNSATATANAAKPTVSLPSLVSDLKESNKSFTFAAPSPVKVQLENPEEDVGRNGVAKFSFCLPEEVVGSSFLSKETSPVLSSTTDISTYNKLPDITAQMSHTKNSLTRRSGSVMDVLGQNNALPDVTASAGVKVATSLRSESVMSFLGRQ